MPITNTLAAPLIQSQFNKIFPDFDPKEKEVFTQQSWKTLFTNSVKKRLPAYIVAVVKCTSDKGDVYKMYDATHFTYYQKYHSKISDVCPLGLDSCTNLPIENIYYLSMDCFQKRKGYTVPLHFDMTKFQILPPSEQVQISDKTIALKDLIVSGCHTEVEPAKEKTLGKIQFLVGAQLFALANKTVNAAFKSHLKSKAAIWSSLALQKINSNKK